MQSKYFTCFVFKKVRCTSEFVLFVIYELWIDVHLCLYYTYRFMFPQDLLLSSKGENNLQTNFNYLWSNNFDGTECI